MVWNYLAIAATTCIAEHLSAHMNDMQWHGIKKAKFGGLQKLRVEYLDRQISVDSSEVFDKYIGDFNFD